MGGDPVYVSLRDEITEMVGEKIYKLLLDRLRSPQPLPHPALRKKEHAKRSLTPSTPVQG